jgi:hypothetical protein
MPFPAWAIPAALGTIGGAAVASFGGKGGGVSVAADPYGRLREPLINWLIPQIGQPGKTYQGEMVAPLSEQESKSFDFLRKYGEQGYGDTFTNAKSEINKTLTNQYDPTTSPYYQAVKARAASNLDEELKGIESDAAGAGRYWTGARLERQEKARSRTTEGLNALLGALAENERQNRLNIIPQALGLAQTEQQLPLQQATAFQTLGQLPRSIQQAQDTATQNEWLRSQVEYPLQIANLAAGIQTPPTYQQNPPSAIQQLLTSAGSMLPYLLLMGMKGKD